MARSPFSGTDATRVWGRKGGALIYQCPVTCAVFFDRDGMTRNDYQDFYPYLKFFDEPRFAWELQIRRRRYERQLDLMSRFAPGRRLLDIGAGPGYLVRVALDRGWDAVGVEIADEAVRCGRARFGVRYVRLEEIEMKAWMRFPATMSSNTFRTRFNFSASCAPNSVPGDCWCCMFHISSR